MCCTFQLRSALLKVSKRAVGLATVNHTRITIACKVIELEMLVRVKDINVFLSKDGIEVESGPIKMC